MTNNEIKIKCLYTQVKCADDIQVTYFFKNGTWYKLSIMGALDVGVTV